MATHPQISVSFSETHRAQLERLSAESGRSVASIIREAVTQYLRHPALSPGAPFTPEGLWAILRDPEHWATFKQIAVEMETQASESTTAVMPAPGDGAGAAPVAPAPTWRFERDADTPPRKPAEEPPF